MVNAVFLAARYYFRGAVRTWRYWLTRMRRRAKRLAPARSYTSVKSNVLNGSRRADKVTLCANAGAARRLYATS